MEEIKVQNMNCMGCVGLIEKELSAKLEDYEIILETKVVRVKKVDVKIAKKLIKKAGFTAH